MSLLRKIQDATVNPEFRLADVLRMCKILSSRLKNPAFMEWIDQELNGYVNQKLLPEYRILRGLSCRGHFFGSFGRGFKNVPIPILSLPEPFQQKVTTSDILHSVSEIESLVDSSKLKNKRLHVNWSADAISYFGKDFYENMVCGEAWTEISPAALVSILDIVKSRILDFILAIEAEAPDAGESELGKKALPESTVNIIFNKCILHPNSQIAVSELVSSQITNHGIDMSENYVNNLQGANIGNMANTVRDNARQQANQHVHLPEPKKTLAEAAIEIQQLLKHLEEMNPTADEIEKVTYVNDETTPSFKRRAVGALQASGETAFDEFVLDNKYLKVVKAAIKGWVQP